MFKSFFKKVLTALPALICATVLTAAPLIADAGVTGAEGGNPFKIVYEITEGGKITFNLILPAAELMPSPPPPAAETISGPAKGSYPFSPSHYSGNAIIVGDADALEAAYIAEGSVIKVSSVDIAAAPGYVISDVFVNGTSEGPLTKVNISDNNTNISVIFVSGKGAGTSAAPTAKASTSAGSGASGASAMPVNGAVSTAGTSNGDSTTAGANTGMPTWLIALLILLLLLLLFLLIILVLFLIKKRKKKQDEKAQARKQGQENCEAQNGTEETK